MLPLIPADHRAHRPQTRQPASSPLLRHPILCFHWALRHAFTPDDRDDDDSKDGTPRVPFPILPPRHLQDAELVAHQFALARTI